MEEKDNLDNTTEPTTKAKVSRRRPLRIASLVLLVIILLSATGFGSYHYEHNKLAGVQSQLTRSNQTNDGLTSEVSALNKKVSSLTTQLNTQADSTDSSSTSTTQTTTQTPPVATDNLNISVLDAYKYYTTKYPNNPYVVVDVTLTNKGTDTLTVPLSSFKLVDSLNNGGVDFGDLAGTTMPSGKLSILADQTLSAGQTVSGALAFNTFNGGYTLFTLSYKSQSFSVNASTSVNQ